jgi:hypothetical protein
MYQESVRNNTAFIGLKCDKFEHFKNNKNRSECDTEQAYMGFIASSETRGNFYLRTHRNIYRLSLGQQSLYFKETEICYGPRELGKCHFEDEFVDRDSL